MVNIIAITGTFDFIIKIITVSTNYIILCHYNILLGHFPILRHGLGATAHGSLNLGAECFMGEHRDEELQLEYFRDTEALARGGDFREQED